MSFHFLSVRRDGPVEYLTLNRPDARNAFNEHLINDLAEWAEAAAADATLRAVVLAGAGPAFCAGADLAWMSAMAAYSRRENVNDAVQTAHAFAALDSLPVPLIGRIHGAALGGGCGLAAVCDIVVAEESAIFGFTEVKLGIMPAIIAPYALAKIGRSAARELFLTGMRFSAARACAIGLVHAVVPATQLDAKVAQYVTELLSAGPEAIAAAKSLIARAWIGPSRDIITMTAEAIAERRVSAEGQEGMKAFLEKRRPRWQVGG